MYLPWNASKARLREAANARRNRLEIVAARSAGQVSRRELFKMGIFTAGGMLAATNGLSPFAKSALADCVTGINRSPRPFPTDAPFTVPMLRPHLLTRHSLRQLPRGRGEIDLMWPRNALADSTPRSRRPTRDEMMFRIISRDEMLSTRRSNTTRITHRCRLKDGVMGRDWPSPGLVGPREGRPPGEAFAHQRWYELMRGSRLNPKGTYPMDPVGAVISYGQIIDDFCYQFNGANHWTYQGPNAIWTMGEGRFVRGANWVLKGDSTFPALLQARYGESVILRHYNNLPFDPAINGGYGRNEPTTHNHNGHNGAESDGAGNAHFFPGQYYDYHFSLMMARHDAGLKDSLGRDLDTLLGVRRGDPRCSTPTNNGDIILVPGDFREIQGTLWFHDHRIAFTSENVHKGYAGLLEYFSGPDRGYERPGLTAAADAVNLRLPSGWRNGKTWGNHDFDIYFAVQDQTFNADEQQCFDIVDTDGFLGDVLHVNYQWKPYLEVLPRKYRFRTLSAGMSRWVQLAVADSLDPNTAQPVPITQIANDGNIFPRFVRNLPQLDQQGTAERYDFVIDFSRGADPASQVGKRYYLMNLIEFSNGRKPDDTLTIGQALSGQSPDPCVGAIMEFRVVSSVPSVDAPGEVNTIANACGANDLSRVVDPDELGPTSWQIPTVAPVRERVIELVRGGAADSGLPFDHVPGDEPWGIKVGNGAAHLADMRRSSNLPRPGDIEHWTFVSGGGWAHPLHLHFEEAITLNRDNKTDAGSIHPTELLKRKDVWHIGGIAGGFRSNPQIQVTFGEFGGAYVNHCHNTVHEDSAMLLRYDLIRGSSNAGIDDVHITVLPTPDPRPTGVTYTDSCHLPEGNPQGFDTGVPECNDPVGPGSLEGGQGLPPEGYVDLPVSTDPRTF
ncbi:MAG: multicopper oxidase domain-containing protein [Candidatus Methylomirabilis oxyfera]|nr:multicopper oxidase domain-containing protein [Candidatus Methylomirabilis oxyfera]